MIWRIMQIQVGVILREYFQSFKKDKIYFVEFCNKLLVNHQ